MLKRIAATLLAVLMLFGCATTTFAAEKTYTISTADDLKLLSEHPDGNFTLSCDIDLDGADWKPVGTEAKPFTGTLDGGGHEIVNVRLADEAVCGFFAYNSGTIKNLTLYNYKAAVSNAKLFGGFAAQNDGTIENCFISVASAEITAAQDAQIGQFAAVNTGRIADCNSALDLTVTAKKNAAVGGLAAVSSGVMEMSEAAGRMIISGNAKAGLICAYAKSPSEITGCAYTGNMAKIGDTLLKNMTVSADTCTTMKECLWRDNSMSPELLSEGEYNRRRKVVDYYNILASFVWVPSRDIEIDYTDNSNSSGQYSQHFYAGQYYYGMAYGPRGKNIGTVLDGFDENGEFKDYVTDGINGWDLYNSADCSSTVTNCWQVISPTVRCTNTSNFMPGYVSVTFGSSGTVQVGDYRITSTAASGGKTAKVYSVNPKQKMAEAICQCLPGDAINSTTKGHVRMVVDTVVMRDKDGKLDYDKTLIVCNGMGDGLSHYHKDIVAYYPFKLSSVLDQEYVPVTVPEFKNGSPEGKIKLSGCASQNRNTICQGTVSSNYGILNCKMEITDEKGKQVWTHTLWERVYYYTNYGSNSNVMARRTFTEFDLSRFATSIADAKMQTGKTYNVRVTTMLTNLETYEVKNYSFEY